MNKIELVLTDIDGTLVPVNTHVASPAIVAAMAAVQQQGVAVVAATARPFEMGRELFTSLGFKGLGIFDGGASIRDVASGEFAWRNWLSLARLHEILDIILPVCTEIDCFPTYNIVDATGIKTSGITDEAPYVFAFMPEEVFPEISRQLAPLQGLYVHAGPKRADKPGLIDIQITDVGSTKFHAVSELRRLVHSNQAHTLAIGDGENDLPLFQNAGIKVAMGNAGPELKAAADFVVADVQHDGFAEAMQRFVLNGQY